MKLDLRKYRFQDPVYITRPSMPPLSLYTDLLKEIWDSRQLTNSGRFHGEFEDRVADFMGAEYVCLFCNGTLALQVGLQALGINDGEAITTPFTFPATVHALHWNNIRPVFCDVEPTSFNLDPKLIESLITPQTRVILPVHVFGTPCDVEAIDDIARRHNLKVIYDAAHAFGVRYKGRPLVDFGDMSMLSFHATKQFTTAEGGALVVHTAEQKERINQLKNFGIVGQETVVAPGINGKMSELQAAFGLLALDLIEDDVAVRAKLSARYRTELQDVSGLRFLKPADDVEPNDNYFPIFINEERFGMNRDVLSDRLIEINVFPRKYFYPLCSDYSCYSSLPSSDPANLPVAHRAASEVLCLPIYGDLPEETVRIVCEVVRELGAQYA